MLSNIRKMILEKKDFQEAASIIFEDGMGNLDDQIVLGEENEKPVEGKPDSVEPEENDDLGDTGIDSSDEGNNEEEPTPAPEPESPADPEPAPEPAPAVEPEEDGAPLPLPTNDGELPTPVGKQTGEPIVDNDDLLDVTIDLKSNTIRDTLPVPPDNAAEAIGGDDNDDLLNQRVDSGFGGEDDNPTPAPVEPEVDMTPAQPPENPSIPSPNPEVPTEEGGEQLTEAITLGNDAPGDDSAPADTTPPDAGDTPPDGGAEAPAEENPITAAVKDKVDEITDDSAGGDDAATSKDDLLKKLGNITKSLEDAKKAIMNTLQ